MAVEKGLYSAPIGIEEEAADEAELEIEIVDPEMVTMSDGSVEVTIIPNADVGDTVPFDANLTEVLEESTLNKLSDELVGSAIKIHREHEQRDMSQLPCPPGTVFFTRFSF